MSDVLLIESLDLEGRGVAHKEGKVVFVEGALPGEEVLAEVKSSWCCVDASTLRPARIAREVMQHFFAPDDSGTSAD